MVGAKQQIWNGDRQPKNEVSIQIQFWASHLYCPAGYEIRIWEYLPCRSMGNTIGEYTRVNRAVSALSLFLLAGFLSIFSHFILDLSINTADSQGAWQFDLVVWLMELSEAILKSVQHYEEHKLFFLRHSLWYTCAHTHTHTHTHTHLS